MPIPKKGPRLGGSPSHQRHILSNLATQLFEHGRITTTEAKARTLRPLAEKLITRAKKAELGSVQSLHNRRVVLKTLRDKSVVHTLFTEIAPKMAERPGGYTRITKIGPRKGDNAPMAVIELVTEAYSPKPKTAKATRTEQAPAAAPVAEETTESPEATETTEATEAEATETEAPAEETATDEAPTEMAEEASPEASVVAEEQAAAEESEGSKDA